MSCACGPAKPLPDGAVYRECVCSDRAAKIAQLNKNARRAAWLPEIRRTAERVVSGARSLPEAAEMLQRYVQGHVLYAPELGEIFTDPARVLELRIGDCDDSGTLLAALLWSIGIRSRVVVADTPRPHVAAQMWWYRRWWWLDAAFPAAAGEEPLAAARRLGIV